MALEVTLAGTDMRNGREILPDVRATLRGGVSVDMWTDAVAYVMSLGKAEDK